MTSLAPQFAAKVGRLEDTLRTIALHHSPAALSSSLAVEDMVLTDAILRHAIAIQIFTLDTGRLHAETLGVLTQVQIRYGYTIAVYGPNESKVARYVQEFGLDGLYRSVELRQRCCHIRKVEPLARALAGKAAWVTGMRRGQSVTRTLLPESELDAQHGLRKFHPLADWTENEVWQYIRAWGVPYNVLQDQGYRSIGCAPCTRPTTKGEDVRAGRWWWENPETKECGLHQRGAQTLVEPRSSE
jgi:phosphoadenosine phosphosulfate reductase